MPEPIHPSKLEEILKDVSNVPDPDVEFINSLRNRFVTEGHASAQKNQETHMKKIFSKRLTWAFAILTLIMLVIVFTRPTVVNALKRLFGYVPNVGIIDQSSEIRVLAEPITQVREGYTVTIEQAVLNNEKTMIVYSYILPPNFSMPDAINTTSTEAPYLLLPDGTRLDIETARHVVNYDCPQCYLRYLMEFSAISNDINEATLVLPDLIAVPSNTAPADWTFQIKFRPANPTDIMPVIIEEVTPIPTNIGTNAPTQTINENGITNTFDKFVELPDGYILYGHTSWTNPNFLPYSVIVSLLSIKDATGKELPFDYAEQEKYAEPNELRAYWAYKINTIDFIAPVQLSFGIVASLPADNGSFIFDPGPNPQLGQKWEINQDVIVNGEVVHVLTAEQGGIELGYFLFQMQSDSNIVSATIIDLAHPPLGGGGGGGSFPIVGDPFYTGFGYSILPIPEGPLTFTFTNVGLVQSGDWTLTWSP